MKDYVICRQSDETGVTEIYGPYEETEAHKIIAARKDRDRFAYYTAVLCHPNDLGAQ